MKFIRDESNRLVEVKDVVAKILVGIAAVLGFYAWYLFDTNLSAVFAHYIRGWLL